MFKLPHNCTHLQFRSVTQLCRTLCDPMNRSTPGLPVHHQLPEFTQTHVHRVGYAIQPSHPLSSPSPPAPNPSQHQSLFQWVNSSHEVAKVLEFQLYHHSFQRTPRTDLLQNGLVGSPCSPRDSQESSPTPQFKSINSLLHSTHQSFPLGLMSCRLFAFLFDQRLVNLSGDSEEWNYSANVCWLTANYSGLQLTGWGPPTLGWGICFTQSTNF